MDEEGRWIKLHSSIWRNPWMYRPNVFVVWVYILCHVEWRPTDVVFEGKRITLQPGQGIFKLRELASIFKIPVTSLRRIINLLKSESQIGTQTSPRNTLITVVNWQKYQTVGSQSGAQVAHNWRTSGSQPVHLPIKKEKEEREEGKNTRAMGPYHNVFLTDEELRILQDKFPDWQRRIDRLSVYMASSGKRYENHLATILYWADQDQDANQAQGQPGLSKEEINELLK